MSTESGSGRRTGMVWSMVGNGKVHLGEEAKIYIHLEHVDQLTLVGHLPLHPTQSDDFLHETWTPHV